MPTPLAALHLAAGLTLGGTDDDRVLRGPDLAGQWAAARDAVVLQDRSAAGGSLLIGPERTTFLHGQTTNDVEGLKPGEGNAAALLTFRGKTVGLVRVLAFAERLLVVSDLGLGEAIHAHLERSAVSEEVEFSPLHTTHGELGLYGPKAAALLASLAIDVAGLAEHHHRPLQLAGAEGFVVASRGPGIAGYDLWLPRGALEAAWQALQQAGAAFDLRTLTEEGYEALRIEAREVRQPAELTEETNPLEAHLERAISYRKGCYVGQEVIAKATFRGAVARKVAGLSLPLLVPPGTELTREGRVLGRITSSAALPDGRFVALASLKREPASTAGLVVELPDQLGQATVVPLAPSAPPPTA